MPPPGGAFVYGLGLEVANRRSPLPDFLGLLDTEKSAAEKLPACEAIPQLRLSCFPARLALYLLSPSVSGAGTVPVLLSSTCCTFLRKTRHRRSLSCTSVADSAATSAARSISSEAEYK